MIKKFFIFKEAIGANNTKLQKLVDEANNLLKKIYDNKLEDDITYRKNNIIYYVNAPSIIKYENGLITINYEDENEENEILEITKDKEKSVISRLNFFIDLFNNSLIIGLKLNNPKYQVLVDKANNLLSQLYEKYGDNLIIFEIIRNDAFEYSKFKPLKFENGNIIIEFENSNNETDGEFIETNYESEKEVINILNKWISIFKNNLVKNKPYYYNKIGDLVTELNYLIKTADITIYMDGESITYNFVNYDYGKFLNFKFYENGRLQNKKYSIENVHIIILLDEIKDLEKIIKLYKVEMLEKGFIILTKLEYENLDNFFDKIRELKDSNLFSLKIKTISNLLKKSDIVDNLDEDLKQYNNIPGLFMEQLGNYIKMFICFSKVEITIHEQYLPKIYKLFQNIKNKT